jgi:hypothetical protein
MERVASKRWIGVVGLPIVGLVLLGWAAEQSMNARLILGSTFVFPTWRILGWLLTLIAAGAVFGLAAGFARAEVSKANVTATLLVGVLPLAVVIRYWTHLSFGWFPTISSDLGIWLSSQATVVACCLVVGSNWFQSSTVGAARGIPC